MSLHQMDLDDMLEDDKPEPGRKLDALVAEHIMGWYWSGDMLGPPPTDKRAIWATEWDSDGLPRYLPKYSTDPAACLELLNSLEISFESMEINFLYGDWYCLIGQHSEDGTWTMLSPGLIGHATMLKAICISALEAYGVPIDELL